MGSASRLCAPALANSPRPTGRGPKKATCGGGLFLIHEPTFGLVVAQVCFLTRSFIQSCFLGLRLFVVLLQGFQFLPECFIP